MNILIPKTILEHLENEKLSEKTAYIQLNSDLTVFTQLSYRELLLKAKSFAGSLVKKNLSNELVVLLFSPDVDFLIAFLGCLYAKAIPISAHVAHHIFLKRSIGRLANILNDSQPKHIIGKVGFKDSVVSALPNNTLSSQFSWHDYEEFKGDPIFEFMASNYDENETAFVQYTSGTTGHPLGVKISHKNLLSNVSSICSRLNFDESCKLLSWLPHSHDMGLVGGLFVPLRAKGTIYQLPTQFFLKEPLAWLEALSKYSITSSPAPNFAYELCVRRYDEERLRQLDLSSWTTAFNGGDLVRQNTLHEFSKLYSKHGFSETSFYPCYGLAEATLMASGGRERTQPKVVHLERHKYLCGTIELKEVPSESTISFVGNGQSISGCEVRVLDTFKHQFVGDGVIGALVISGESVSSGYLSRSENPNKMISLEGMSWFITSDIGFTIDSELFVVGRSDDVIVLNGEKIHPIEIEESIRKNFSGAGFEEVVVFANPTQFSSGISVAVELSKEIFFQLKCNGKNTASAQLKEALRSVVFNEFVNFPEVFLIRNRTLPRTTSGKIQRQQCSVQMATLDQTNFV